ncbi:hypothetical protein CBS147332_763 [Penicillium roqueforti]|nr:hypothetical protein CBS147332_763 [Penicillium roqueforti]KAI3105945.1 hypothetical protein CBS147331_6654 [Penicillium roqueforti]
MAKDAAGKHTRRLIYGVEVMFIETLREGQLEKWITKSTSADISTVAWISMDKDPFVLERLHAFRVISEFPKEPKLDILGVGIYTDIKQAPATRSR